MAPEEELLDKHDVTVFVGENKFSTEGVRIPQQAPPDGELRAALADPAFAPLAHLGVRHSRDFILSLIVCRAAIDDSFDVMICGDGSRSLNTWPRSNRHARYKLVVSYSENIWCVQF